MVHQKAGQENTVATLKAAILAAKKHQLKYMVVASTYGNTAQKAVELLRDSQLKLIAVTHNTGFSQPGEQQFDSAIREQVEQAGGIVLIGTMVLRNLGAAIRSKLKYSETEIVNATLRMFGQGIKVIAEMAAMVCDAGLVPPEDIVVVAGTGRGADTAAIVKADSSNRFFDIKIREIIVKPADF